MKPRKHKRKESFSVLLVSNTGHNSRQFHVTKSCLKLLMAFVLLLCVTFGWFAYHYLTGQNNVSRAAGVNKNKNENEMELNEQITAQQAMIQQLEEEKEDLTKQNNALTSENKALLAAAKSNLGTEDKEAESAEGIADDDSFPSRYPYTESGIVATKYSQDHPYISIETREEGNIVASGTGTIAEVSSDEEYPLIIEIEHGNGYRTRYMFVQDAESIHAEGDQVQIGDTLAVIGAQNEQLDYQVILEDEPIDPLIVFEAKG
ncbi:MAG: peptidoglycan DD-metalloendopeptidase family protein [Eubacterium sp.]|nr:peptidoglycan DD-metalloendopeptidase family protein [Eubacterium sp.]